jgi:hypothetical protein
MSASRPTATLSRWLSLPRAHVTAQVPPRLLPVPLPPPLQPLCALRCCCCCFACFACFLPCYSWLISNRTCLTQPPALHPPNVPWLPFLRRKHEPLSGRTAAPAQQQPGGSSRGRGGAGGSTRSRTGELAAGGAAVFLPCCPCLLSLIWSQHFPLHGPRDCIHTHNDTKLALLQVLVTAGYTGEIRIYENIGLPQWL